MQKLVERAADARHAAQVEAYNSIVIGGMTLVFAAFLAVLGIVLWRHRNDDDGIYRLFACAAWLVAVFLTIPGVWSFVDPWTWAAINYPDLWIAHKLPKI